MPVAFVLETAEILKAGVISCNGTPSATMQNELDMGGNRVVSVGDPTDPQDVATKAYVDTQDRQHILKAGDTMTGELVMSGNLVSGLYPRRICHYTLVMKQHHGVRWWASSQTRLTFLSKRGADTVTGPLTMSDNKVTTVAEPTSPHDAATKNYVDIWDDLRVLKVSDTMTGPLAMSTNKITAVADPTDPQDVATKNHVDAQGGGNGPSMTVICRVGVGTTDHRSIDLGASPHVPIGPLFGRAFGDEATSDPVASLFTAPRPKTMVLVHGLSPAAGCSLYLRWRVNDGQCLHK